MSSIESRKRLRKELRQKRQALTAIEQENAAIKLLDQWQTGLLAQVNQKQIKKVAIYLTNDGELSPHMIADHVFHNGSVEKEIELFLPILEREALLFARYSKNSQWQKNRYGIKEPIDDSPLEPHELDLVLLPLVGFDEHGGRLGMGGGFYDKSFEHKENQKRPLLVGLAHECQKVEMLPIESWDVPLDGIMTPERVIVF
ncbi:5-formyltetrahydrofolate cyclo-ligase [Marinomonas balearica]|uniref:5-formyltetrahydrofolate cyclo-ligase n=1 Tax=Marinomonas balearica TaxID=491947 RepID=A0A4R6M9I3_9GAMM|nr:5-formyltetrahydrofolate cyclo-ligase [Marinomonas balearica]TDO98171.1 5-formyltetrahydrofolate cyclo-ligase [Marinomonas balearica]